MEEKNQLIKKKTTFLKSMFLFYLKNVSTFYKTFIFSLFC